MSDITAFVLKGYPRLSETFIAQEIRALEQQGLNIQIFSLRHPTDIKTHPVHAEIQAPVYYLPEYLRDEPGRFLMASLHALINFRFYWSLLVWLKDLFRDPSHNRGRRFGQAMVLAHELSSSTIRIHAHFLHTPASVARYASIMRKLPWSCSAHAKDIWTIPDWEKREKLHSCQWLTTCTRYAANALQSYASDHNKVHLNYHGIDLNRFPYIEMENAAGDGCRELKIVNIITVGRAVAKKGFSDLLLALSYLPANLDWRLNHVGDGPLLSSLKSQAKQLQIDEKIQWLGSVDQAELLTLYRNSQLMVLPSQVTEDGDRDGLPNVLLEAQSQGLPVVSTDISGIPELVEHEKNGLLVPQRDPHALSQAIARLLSSQGERRQLGQNGRKRIYGEFSAEMNIQNLAKLFFSNC